MIRELVEMKVFARVRAAAILISAAYAPERRIIDPITRA
jgi:hypothetical protein